MPSKPNVKVAQAYGGPIDGGLVTVPPIHNIDYNNFVNCIPLGTGKDTFDYVRPGTKFALYLWEWKVRKFTYIKTVTANSRDHILQILTETSKGYPND